MSALNSASPRQPPHRLARQKQAAAAWQEPESPSPPRAAKSTSRMADEALAAAAAATAPDDFYAKEMVQLKRDNAALIATLEKTTAILKQRQADLSATQAKLLAEQKARAAAEAAAEVSAAKASAATKAAVGVLPGEEQASTSTIENARRQVAEEGVGRCEGGAACCGGRGRGDAKGCDRGAPHGGGRDGGGTQGGGGRAA